MPASSEILSGLTSTANGALWLAVLWHVALGALLLGLALGWRPPRRVLAGLLALPLASVSLLAFRQGNPFNGAVFVLLAVLLAGLGLRVGPGRVAIARGWAAPLALALIGVTLLLEGLGSRGLSWMLALAGLFYGVVGVGRLGVVLDLGLLVGAAALGVQAALGARATARRDRATVA